MKRYTASELVEMAMKRADITNTDFLDHDEITKYLNESWKTVYQFLINKGDKQFVEEVRLNGSSFGGTVEYDLPDDFYQMLSLRDNSGFCIPRKSESEGNQSCTYEIVNDKLRLYGATGPLILTYYVTPIWITYPDKDIEVETPEDDIVSTCKNSYIDADGRIKDVLTKETKAVISSTYTNRDLYLGNGHVVYNNGSTWNYLDFDSNLMYENLSATQQALIGDMRCLINMESNVIEIRFGDSVIKTIDKPSDISAVLGGSLETLICLSDDHIAFYRNDEWVHTNLYLDPSEVIQMDRNRFLLKEGSKVKALQLTDNNEYYVEDIECIGAYRLFKYGPMRYTGYCTLQSGYEDTLFNFPNELYVSLIADDLAIRFMFKMNAESTGLMSQYEADKAAFANTLSQDGSYSRIRNAYRR